MDQSKTDTSSLPQDPTTSAPTPFFKRRWVQYIRDGLLMILVVTLVGLYQTRNLLKSQQPAPTWKLRTLDGTPHTLTQYKGKKTVLFFWAPWCTVCHLESDNIKAVKRFHGDDLHVISIASSYEQVSDVQAFMDKHKIDYTVLLGNKTLLKQYRVSAFPTLYVLDKDGLIEDTVVGYTTQAGLHLRVLF